jgi:23S rRNA (uracil1939-C5)-methyltransferase
MSEIAELKIEKLVYGGEGLGHHDGRAVFVPLVVPNEVVSISPVEQKKKFVRGRLTGIVTPSPARTTPPCPHFGTCGGCHYQHISYEEQVGYKTGILRETLARLGRVSWNGPIAAHASPPFGYRNRAQWKIARHAGTPAIGYYEHSSQRLCPVAECPVVSPLMAQTLAVLSRLVREGKLSADLHEAEAFTDHSDAKLLLNLSYEQRAAAAEELALVLRAELPGLETLLVHDRRADRFDLSGPGHLCYRVGDFDYQVGHLSFFQSNRFLLQELINLVLGDARGSLALDLFAGVGLFTLPLAHRFQRVVGVESNAAAARDLKANLQQSGAASPAARCANVEAFLARWNDSPDLVVLDPQRLGVPAPALARLIKLAPRAISYLSCDPATLARDLATLVGTDEKPGSYRISEVHLVDIFPQTYHIEALVRLSRRA